MALILSADAKPILPSHPEWYRGGDNDPTLDPAREAFAIGKEKFSEKLTADQRKVDLVSSASHIQDLQKLVEAAHLKYVSKHEGNKVQKWLTRFSRRMMHYENIIDVLVSSHPEYAALVWGVIKLVFISVMNHENLVATVTKALVQLADSLPGLEVTASLYPTKQMKLALAEIYANVIRFLVRAYDWFEETNRFVRAIHSITRPKELRYDDILEDIATATSNLRILAVTSAQAETRDMHVLLLEMKQLMITHQTINASAQVSTNNILSDLQFSQILSQLSNNVPLLDPDKVLHSALFLSRRFCRSHHPEQHLLLLPSPPSSSSSFQFASFSSTTPEPVWKSPQFTAWSRLESNSTSTSSLITIRATPSSRQSLRAFLASTVANIQKANMPAIWALHIPDPHTNTTTSRSPAQQEAVEREDTDTHALPILSFMDLLKYLTLQAIQLSGGSEPKSTTTSFSVPEGQYSIKAESTLALTCTQIHTARTEKEWLNLLVASLARLRRVYLIIDTELLAPFLLAAEEPISIPGAFLMVLEELKQNAPHTTVKILLSACSSLALGRLEDPSRMNIVVVGENKLPVSRGLAARMMRGRPRSSMGYSFK